MPHVGAYHITNNQNQMTKNKHFPRDGEDIPIPKAKRVFSISESPNAVWMGEMIKKCLILNV